MLDLPSQIGALSPKQQELLKLLLEKKKQEKAAAQTQSIPRRPPSDRAPLSFAQQRVWFLDQLDPGNLAYNIPAAVRLTGPLDSDVLEQSLNTIGRRHETLRTVFGLADKQPVQIIRPELPIAVEQVDLRDLPLDEQEDAFQRRATQEFQRPFDLRRGPLWRVILLRMAETRYVVLLVIHHIIGDTWSIRALIRELAIVYAALSRGQPVPLPELPVQYGDFALWQRQTLQGRVLEDQLGYWREQLQSAPGMLELPADRARPAVQSFWGAKHNLAMSQTLTEALKELSRREGVSLFMTLLAAYKTLLYRYTDQNDIVVGTPVANRNRLELEGMIGYLVNTLVLRTGLSGDLSFRALLARVRQVALGAFAHQDLPFERLVMELQPERDMSRNALYQVDFILQNSPPAALEASGLILKPTSIETGTSQVDITLDLTETSEGLAGWFAYDTDLFDATTMARMGRHLTALLDAIVADPDRPIAGLPLMPEAERRQVVAEWNDTSAETPYDQCLHDLFAAQARQAPDSIAVVFKGAGLTYAELNRRANQLAHYLQGLGIGPDVRVGLCLDRSLEMVIALLGVLKAGGTYVPLDPAYPKERIAFMLADARPAVLLTTTDDRRLTTDNRQPSDEDRRLNIEDSSLDASEKRSSILDPPSSILSVVGGPWSVVDLAADWPRIAQCPTSTPTSGVTPCHLAYVIYTSGSTGTPKGVEISHRALVNFLCSMGRRPGLTARDCLLSVTTLSFDIAGLEIYLPLIVGARLVLVPREEVIDGALLFGHLRDTGATVMQATPSTWRVLLAAGWQGRPQVRVLCGGEALPRELAQQLLDTRATLWNLYGPTETTIWSTACRLDRQTERITIGRPIANTTVYLLNRQLQPVPVGVPGELCIGGAGVARGYLNRPALTAERFIPDPFGRQPGARLYKTGDLARYLPDGTIEFRGRIDHQVKVRGYRIELEEIETVLRRHPAVRAAVVIAREDKPGDRRLVAYLTMTTDNRRPTTDSQDKVTRRQGDKVMEDGETFTCSPVHPLTPSESSVVSGQWSVVSELRAFLQERLPEYMVPSVFVALDALPLTPNGKIDRKALPAPDRSYRGREQDYVAPRTAIEEQVAQIWKDVLGLDRVGVYDNFFELGGHSLLATQIISRICTVFQIALPLRSIFEAPTLERLCRRIAEAEMIGSLQQTAPIVPTPRDGREPLSFAQERLWVIHQLMPQQAAYNIPGAIRLTGKLDVALLEQSVEEIIRRHEILRTTFANVDGQPIQVIHPPQPFRLQFQDLRHIPADEREALAVQMANEDGRRAFDLETGPLLHGQLFQLGDTDYLLEITIHHIVYDIWSREVFVRELSAIYTSRHTGRPLQLPPLAVQYADFARWQRAWLGGDVLAGQLDYWRRQFADGPPMLELPTDFPRGAAISFEGRRQYLYLSSSFTDAIIRFSQQAGTTVFIVLFAAFKVLLYRYTGQPDIVVGTPIANRHRLEIEPLIGFFVNTLVMRTNLAGNPSFLESVRRVRETALGAYTHQDLPFERLVAENVQHRNLNVHPLFQVMFNFLNNYSTPTIDLPDVSLRIQPLHNGTTQFDLTIHAWINEGRLHAAFEYNSDLFKEATILRMIAHFEVLLEGIIADAGQPIMHLPLLKEAERQRILFEWNDTERAGSLDLGVAQVFEAQVARTPDTIAISCDGEYLTYRELNRRANRLAHALVERGIGPDLLVALLADRGPQHITALLAIFKAGGAYLPLDPQHPAERIYQVLRQSKSPLVLTTGEFEPVLSAALAGLPTEARPTVCQIGALLEQAASEQNPPPVCHPHNLAYIMFTSGSTGLPKGVMVEHAGMLNHIAAKSEDLGLSGADTVAQNGPQCFDIFVWQCLAALLLGGRVHVFTDLIALDPARLLDQIEQQGVTVLQLVPSMLRALVQEVDARGERRPALVALRWAVPTGDALPTELCRLWLQRYPRIPLLNTYGSTECSDDQCHYVVEQVQAAEHATPIMSIGTPIRNMRAYVLDRALAPVPVGVVGELYIGGVGVGRGYLDDPLRTAAVFIPDPFGPEPGARLYRTRDTVRYLADGAIEFIGRNDHLVKIHGMRIEPGEIEAVLSRHPAIRDVVVVAREDTPGARRLVAYVVPTTDDRRLTTDSRDKVTRRQGDKVIELGEAFTRSPAQPFTPSEESVVSGQWSVVGELRMHLAGHLPEYMIPSAFVVLEALPLTSNGKIDRKALPAPDPSTSDRERTYVAPRTPLEAMLAEILAEALKLERVGIYDNFFGLGGHSLLAIQALSRIERDLAIRLPLRAFFERPTIADLAKNTELARWAIRGQTQSAVVSEDDEEGEV